MTSARETQTRRVQSLGVGHWVITTPRGTGQQSIREGGEVIAGTQVTRREASGKGQHGLLALISQVQEEEQRDKASQPCRMLCRSIYSRFAII